MLSLPLMRLTRDLFALFASIRVCCLADGLNFRPLRDVPFGGLVLDEVAAPDSDTGVVALPIWKEGSLQPLDGSVGCVLADIGGRNDRLFN